MTTQTANYVAEMPQNGCWQSKRGVEIQLSRISTPEGRIPQVELRYGKGGKGKIAWWPDVPRCAPQVHRVLACFRVDCTSLGKPIPASDGSQVANLIPFKKKDS